MTCIVSYVDKKNRTMWMGADSLSSNFYSKASDKEHKIVDTGDYLIGHCGYSRAFQVIKYSDALPVPRGNIHEFMCIDFVENVKAILASAGYLRKSDEVLGLGDNASMFIVATRGRVFDIYHNFQINEVSTPYSAAGSGGQVAMGSMYSINKLGFLQQNVEFSIKTAIGAASEFVPTVGGKIVTLSKEY